MARRSEILFIALMVLFSTLTILTSGRKLLAAERRREELPAVDGSLYLAALPRGKVPNSAPSKKGHADIVDEKLIARHLAAVDRILRSVPSPGMGH